MRSPVRLVLATLAILASLASAFPPDRSENKGVASIVGDWRPTLVVRGGKEMPADLREKVTFRITADTITAVEAERPNNEVVKFRIDWTKKPTFIDFAPADGMPGYGILQLDGDRLKICLEKNGRERPTEFISPAGSRATYMELTRKKAEPKK